MLGGYRPEVRELEERWVDWYEKAMELKRKQWENENWERQVQVRRIKRK